MGRYKVDFVPQQKKKGIGMLQNFWNVVSATNMPAQRDFFLGSMLTVTEVLADHPVLDTAQVIAAGSHLIRRLKTHQRLDAFFSVVVNRVELRSVAQCSVLYN